MKKPKSLNINRKEIEKRKQKLEKVKGELKEEFVGIDYIIDELIDYIQIWYLMPEVLSRPIIVSLWGMTGVGKTDLIRKMVSKLDYLDRFAEVELSNSETSSYYSWHSSVAGILNMNKINDNKPAIILFDEIQRFNTLDPEGNPLPNVRFQDFWELLSDGKLARRDQKEDVDRYLEDYLYNASRRKKQQMQPPVPNPDGGEIEQPYNPYGDGTEGVGIWTARELKRIFGIEGDLQKLAELTEEEVLAMMMSRKKKKKVYEPIDHSKTLIIISGNLDEAFRMAADTAETDVDADIFHAYTEKLTLVDIKTALNRKFRPEQVARFGNIHLIYRSLKKKDFQTLIEWEITKIVQKNQHLFGVELTIQPNVNQLIYQNGVFPVQGVRPVFSSVIDILERNLAKILFHALMNNEGTISIDYDFEEKHIIAQFPQAAALKLPYVGRVDKIRESQIDDVVANVSVHESGHAVVYGALFGLAPLQLKSRVASTYVGGFTFPHQIHQTKQTMIDKIKVYLAGGLAEELVFGTENATIGRENDRWETTVLALDYIRKYGFTEEYQAFYTTNPATSMDVFITDEAVENLIKKLVVETKDLLAQHKDFLVQLSVDLAKQGSMKAEDVAAIASQYGLSLVVKEESHLYIADYATQLK